MRIRTIKPEFWSSEDIKSIGDWHARLVFIGLWSYVDDSGRGVADARLIAADLFPLEDDPIEARRRVADALATLSRPPREGSRELIEIYRVDGKDYLYITNWKKHQRIDKPGKSRLPAPPHAEPDEDDTPLATDSRQSPDIPALGTGERGTGEQGNRGEAADAEPSRFCGRHPKGTERPCGPCGTARTRHAEWVAREADRVAAARAAAATARLTCTLCRGTGWVVDADKNPIARCDHGIVS